MSKRISYKNLCNELAARLAFALNYGKFTGMRMSMVTGESQETMAYLADGLEMVPGVTVDRKRMYMSAKEKQAYDRAKHKSQQLAEAIK